MSNIYYEELCKCEEKLDQQAETIKQLHQEKEMLEAGVERLEKKEVEFDYLYVALFNLVSLKSHKDTFGKTDYYQHEQPLLWQAARDVLTGKECNQSLAHIQDDAILDFVASLTSEQTLRLHNLRPDERADYADQLRQRSKQ
mgnify:CR=1 FL=1